MGINIAKLTSELAAAGLPVKSVRAEGLPVADYSRELTFEERDQAANIIALHDPVDYALSVSPDLIAANGEHVSILRVQAAGGEVVVDINGTPTAIPLVDGVGELQIKSDTPARIVITGTGRMAAMSAVVYAR